MPNLPIANEDVATATLSAGRWRLQQIGFVGWIGIGLACLMLTISVGISLGAVSIPIDTVWLILLRRVLDLISAVFPPAASWSDTIPVTWSAGRESIVLDVRAPRVILGVLVGASLGVVGAVLQAATRNALVDPHLLGISSGAACGAIIALLHTGLVFGLATVPAFAFGGALSAMVLVMAAARLTRSATADRLVLCGVAVSFIVSAVGSLLIYIGDPRASHTVIFWMLGGLGLAQWNHLIYPLAVLIPALGYFLLRALDLNALALGDETAATLGLAVPRFRMSVFVVSALLTGTVVAFSGAIGFVGLMMPHIARKLFGSDNRLVIPAAGVMGAIALVAADVGARTIMAPEDIPIGVITGLVGGVCFILLLRRPE